VRAVGRPAFLDWPKGGCRHSSTIMAIKYVKPSFPVDAFAGTADYYRRFRIPYPDALLRDLIARVGLGSQAALLDLGCGPGRLTLPLAPQFHAVVALDLEPEMIQVGRRVALERGLTNLTWKISKAEELDAAPESFYLITIGEAFHRFDQQRVSQQSLSWLKPAGGIALLGCNGVTVGDEPWQRIVAEVVRTWTQGSGRPSQPVQPDGSPEHMQNVLREAGFTEVANHTFVQPYVWTVDSIVGNLHSTSFCSERVLGSNADQFRSALTSALLKVDPSGRYPQNVHFGYTFGRKPIAAGWA